MTLEKLILNYIKMCSFQNNLDKKTIKAYRIDLKQFSEYIEGKLFYDKKNIVEYIYFLSNKNYKIKTIKRKIATLKAFFSYLNYEDIMEINPFNKIKIKLKEPLILPKTISIDILIKLFQHIYNQKKLNCKNVELIRNILILEILLGTGIRVSELCNLKIKQIYEDDKYIKIYGKGSKERIIPILDDNIWGLVKEYKSLNKNSEKNYFFINRLGNKISDQSIRNMINNYCKKADIEFKITPHMFRHTFASMLLEENIDIRNIQQILGHSNIITTQIYTHITSNKKLEIMKNNNPRNKIVLNKG